MCRWITLLALASVPVLSAAPDESERQAKPQGADIYFLGKIGEKAPDFTLEDQNGRTVKLSDYSGKVVVLEWLSRRRGLRYQCYGYIRDIRNQLRDKPVEWLAIDCDDYPGGLKVFPDTPAGLKKWATRFNRNCPILRDKGAVVARKYGATFVPSVSVINSAGVIVYSGSPLSLGEEEPPQMNNYVLDAVEAALEGRSPKPPMRLGYAYLLDYAEKMIER